MSIAASCTRSTSQARSCSGLSAANRIAGCVVFCFIVILVYGSVNSEPTAPHLACGAGLDQLKVNLLNFDRLLCDVVRRLLGPLVP